MPYPENISTALSIEKIIAKEGALPATIGIINGEIVVGLTSDEIEQFARRKDVAKVSRRDLPIVVSRKMWGATTVAATMIASAMAKIEVFVTGGIGGVHRGAENTFDISADLQELANTNVTVVCAGAKAILDLPLTLEYLETHGVPVIGYKSDEFASFYSVSSGLPVDVRCEKAQDIATIIAAKRMLNLKGAILVSNPIPLEHSIDNATIEKAIETALLSMRDHGISGKEVTPYLLSKIEEVTCGKSLAANIALIENNARLGAEIAKCVWQDK
jgi:pseudouridine-5'-phosphate glycosidase